MSRKTLTPPLKILGVHLNLPSSKIVRGIGHRARKELHPPRPTGTPLVLLEMKGVEWAVAAVLFQLKDSEGLPPQYVKAHNRKGKGCYNTTCRCTRLLFRHCI